MTEIRAAYYDTYGTRHLQDVFDVAGNWVDGVKWAGGSFSLVPPEQVRAFSDIAHENDGYVSSGGWIETVLRYGDDAVDQYLKEAKDVGDLIDRGKRALDAGASIIMIESEGITENVVEWNTGAAASIINGLGQENVMFEAADGPVFEWYVKNYGNECNLFVDHNQILQLEGLRQNIWGNKSTWGRVINPRP